MDVPRDREIIHSLPRDFTVDGHRGVRRPIGMCGQRLEVETHVVTGTASFLNNIVQCVERAGLVAEALVLEPIATSESVATPDERELGVALIDIGGGTSDIAVFGDGSISYSDVISVGGNHVTRDISIGLRTPFEIAERLKIERGVASPALIPHGEALEVMTAGSGERLRLPRAVLGEIIEARMTELFEMARDSIGLQRLQKRAPAGVILAGGGALLPGAVELAQQIFDAPVRLGKPIDLAGWSEQVDSPQFATAVGLLRFALRQKSAQAGMGAQSTLGVVGVDPQRRIWSVPAQSNANWTIPTPHATPAELAQKNVYADKQSQRELTQRDLAQRELLHGDAPSPSPSADNGSTPASNGALHANGHAPDGEVHETPFDHEANRYDEYELEEEPLWKRLLTKLRQLIGFESS
jgi:cell division protein FtsA